ncbi:hypothetical protein [Jannaschia seosinensis]|uniref:hypothetical protein n=1 Tax=Jannaschia seosinensis TaxID=313367 RepID=UPI001C913CB5|nr:hypothetical protein [Jannaschia seosinensis]
MHSDHNLRDLRDGANGTPRARESAWKDFRDDEHVACQKQRLEPPPDRAFPIRPRIDRRERSGIR